MRSDGPSKVEHIIICGGGLAGWMVAGALANVVAETIKITLVGRDAPYVTDLFYGLVLPPAFYAFHLDMGLSEPELLLESDASLTYGAHVENWALSGRSWVQAFHQPLPVWEGLPLTKLLPLRPETMLQDLLVSAQAGRANRFAHPPEDTDHPLSRAEYGYVIAPSDLARIYRDLALAKGVNWATADISRVEMNGSDIRAVTLDDGQRLSGDLFVDCTGPQARLFADQSVEADQTVGVRVGVSESEGESGPAHLVRSDHTGWQSMSRMRHRTLTLSVFDPDQPPDASPHADETEFAINLNSRQKPWTGNRVAIGQAAMTLEPLSTAPLKLLLADVQRLVSLVPVTTHMEIEARNYNRLFGDDALHARIFHQAHFALQQVPEGRYWQARASEESCAKLTRKLTQYESRGHLVAYDRELFDAVDWAVLHDGMGRRPARIDPLARHVDADNIDRHIHNWRSSTEQVVAKMPPRDIYLSKFLSYLQRKGARHG